MFKRKELSEMRAEAFAMGKTKLMEAILALRDEYTDLQFKERPTPEEQERREQVAAALGVFQEVLNERFPGDSPRSRPGPHSYAGRSMGTPFRSLGEQCVAIARSSRPGAQVDHRLHEVHEMRAALGGSETVPSEGGFLLQQDFESQILTSLFAPGKLAGLCRRITISSNANSIKIPGLDETSRVTGSRWGGVTAGWIAEASEFTASIPKFRQITLELKKLGCLVYVTDELLADSTVLENVLRKIAADELSFNLENAIVNGTGSGQPLGILNAGSLVTQVAEGGQGATVKMENVAKMWSRMPGPLRSSAVWLVNPSVEPQLYTMSLSVGTGGGPVFLPAGGASASPYMTLFGRPILTCEYCPVLGTLGDIVLGNFQEGYILAEKGGVQSAMSIHVAFSSDQSVFRFSMRVDGCPVLAQAVTPFKGSDKVGHFIALATR